MFSKPVYFTYIKAEEARKRDGEDVAVQRTVAHLQEYKEICLVPHAVW